MTPADRHADREIAREIARAKEAAEDRMALYDAMTPEMRAQAREGYAA